MEASDKEQQMKVTSKHLSPGDTVWNPWKQRDLTIARIEKASLYTLHFTDGTSEKVGAATKWERR